MSTSYMRGCRLLWSISILYATLLSGNLVSTYFTTHGLLNHLHRPSAMSSLFAHKWDLVTSDLCDCGHQQTMNQMVHTCPSTKFDGALMRLMMTQPTGWTIWQNEI